MSKIVFVLLLEAILLLTACVRPATEGTTATASDAMCSLPGPIPTISASESPILTPFNATPTPEASTFTLGVTPEPTDVDYAVRDQWMEKVRRFGLDELTYDINDESMLMRKDMAIDGARYGDTLKSVSARFGASHSEAPVLWSAIDYWYREEVYTNGIVAGFLSKHEDKGYTLRDVTVTKPGIEGPRGIYVGDPVQKIIDRFAVRENVDFQALYAAYPDCVVSIRESAVVLFAQYEYQMEDGTVDRGYFVPYGEIFLYPGSYGEDYSIEYYAPYEYEAYEQYFGRLISEEDVDCVGEYPRPLYMQLGYGIKDGVVKSIYWDVFEYVD